MGSSRFFFRSGLGPGGGNAAGNDNVPGLDMETEVSSSHSLAPQSLTVTVTVDSMSIFVFGNFSRFACDRGLCKVGQRVFFFNGAGHAAVVMITARARHKS
jgi:hypothetical protein